MKKLLTLLALGMSLAVGVAHAADDKTDHPQQNKMKMCNAEAKGKKGDEHKKFMKECLSAKPAGSAAVAATPATPAVPATPAAPAAAAKPAAPAAPAVAAAPAADAKPAAQKDKMKLCSAEGKGKKGEEHKKFMKECLSK